MGKPECLNAEVGKNGRAGFILICASLRARGKENGYDMGRSTDVG